MLFRGSRACLPTSALLVVASALIACAGAPAGEADGATESDLSSGASNAKISGGPKQGVPVRSTPNPVGKVVKTVPNGTRLAVKCRTTGGQVGGDDGWDFLPGLNGYVPNKYVERLGAAFPTCGPNDVPKSATPAAPAAPSAPADAGAPPDPPSATPPADPDSLAGGGTGDIVTEARSYIGTHETGDNCNPFSDALGRPCEAWCADFAEYVWQQAGMNTDGVTAYAGSFLTYGQQKGTLKDRNSPDVQPGDAVVWANSADDAAHVGIVAEVKPNGDVSVVNGNYQDDVEEAVSARDSQVSGMGIAGFVSPVPLQ
jgi:hypothetical protein